MTSASSERDAVAAWRSGLDAQQTEALSAPLGPLAILAGPGSGKTKTLVARIGMMSDLIGPANVAAFSHTTKAAGEMRSRLGRLRPGGCSTIHAAAWRLLRAHWADFGELGQLQANMWPVMRDAARSVLGQVATETISDLLSETEASRAAGIGADQWRASASGRDLTMTAGQFQDVWLEFNSVKARNNWWDFGDVLERATIMAADGVGGWDAVFVDEYQDIDAVQEHLVRLWTRAGNISVVGDVDQAIFGFKGGDSRFLAQFKQSWPDAVVVGLVNNYRSTTPIVTWTNRLAQARTTALHSVRGDGERAAVYAASDENDEERALVAALARWHNEGLDWSDMAVLYRFNVMSARVEAALGAASIPYRLEKGDKFFDRADVRRVLVPFGSAARVRPHVPGAELLAACALDVGFDLAVEPAGSGQRRESWEAVRALAELAVTLALPAGELLAELQNRAKQAHCLTPGGVTLATVHAAKGLEWEAVWVLGMVEGAMPSSYATTAKARSEEQHLAYVAVSRARTKLTLSWAKRRHNGWNSTSSPYLDMVLGPDRQPRRAALHTRTHQRAPYQGEHTRPGSGRHAVTASVIAPAASTIATCSRCAEPLRGAAARRSRICSVKCLDNNGADLFQQLLQWRTDTATELRIAAGDVASDKTLFGIAATRSLTFATAVRTGNTPLPGALHP